MTLVMQEEIVDAEIVPSKIDALASIERAIEHVDGFWAEVRWQVENEVWSLLGYADFDALWDDRYAGVNVGVLRAERPETVRVLRSAGQTQQQVADKLGVGVATIKREDASLKVSNDTFTGAAVTNSRGQSRPATYKKREQPEPDKPLNVDKTTGEIKAATEVAPTAHQSPFAAGETIKDFGNGTVITAGYSGLAESTAESVTAALNWYRANPTSGTEECEAATGVSERVAERSRAALIGNKEIPDPKPNRLVERFDKIAHGLTYIADDLEKHLEDLDRAEPEDLEYGREFFEDAMTKLNHFRRKLNTKFA